MKEKLRDIWKFEIQLSTEVYIKGSVVDTPSSLSQWHDILYIWICFECQWLFHATNYMYVHVSLITMKNTNKTEIMFYKLLQDRILVL